MTISYEIMWLKYIYVQVRGDNNKTITIFRYYIIHIHVRQFLVLLNNSFASGLEGTGLDFPSQKNILNLTCDDRT